MTQKQIVTYLINTDETLHNDYQIYQGLLKAIDNKYKEFETLMVKISGKGVFQSAKELRQNKI